MDSTVIKNKKMVHIVNPQAGKGASNKLKKTIKTDEYIYVSESVEASSDFIKQTCKEEPNTCFTVYGGDGTIFRAVNALMESGYNDTASLKIVPAGSGNDFVRSFEDIHGDMCIDVMKFNDKYAVNVINMGFDCNVVQRASKLKKKPLITGKMAYIYGVVGELIKKKPLDLRITMTYENKNQEVLEGKFLLCAVANAKWYGGGFKVAPLADVADGVLDVMIVKNVSRKTFLGFVGDYKKGTLLDEYGNVKEKAQDIVIYKRCTAIKIEGCKVVCADGEIFDENTVDISVIPKALNYIN
ncbi:MAG: hypothetical protein J6B45_02365 [Clostridia bacterium]|nr:hypothetical protein [Clostridia bacterium]